MVDSSASHLVAKTVACSDMMLVVLMAEKLAPMLAERMAANLVVKLGTVRVAGKDGNLVVYLVVMMADCKAAT